MEHSANPQNIPHIRIENENEISKHYDLQKVIGQGAFGVVHLAVDRSTNTRYACKTIKKKSGSVSTYEQQEREVGILKMLNHVNICQLVAVYESSKSIALVMELCEGGELIDFVKDQEKSMPDSLIRDIITQLITAVTYLHRNRIVHRDIKPENILLKSKNEIIIKMADFGLACFTDGIYQVDNIAGTPLYMAPEIVQKLGYNHSCDIWSVGVMLYLLLCKYQKNSEAMVHEMVTKGKIEYPDFLWHNIDPRAKQLTEMILRFDPAKRISAGEILGHPWITDQVGNNGNNNVLDLMKSYNAERRLRKALLFVQACVRFRSVLPKKNTDAKPAKNKDLQAGSAPLALKTAGASSSQPKTGKSAVSVKSERSIAPAKTDKSSTMKIEKSSSSERSVVAVTTKLASSEMGLKKAKDASPPTSGTLKSTKGPAPGPERNATTRIAADKNIASKVLTASSPSKALKK